MELFEGSVSLLLKDISLLKKRLCKKTGGTGEKEVLYTLVDKLMLLKEISGEYHLTHDSFYEYLLQSYRKSDLDHQVSDFISKKGNYRCFVQSILPILEEKWNHIISFPKSHTLTKKEIVDIIKDYVSKEHPEYYESFISFLKGGIIFSSNIPERVAFTNFDMVLNHHNVMVSNKVENDALFMSNLIHEFGHVVDANHLSGLIDKDYNTREILSIKWEREFLSFLLENKIQIENAYTVLKDWYQGGFIACLSQEFLCVLPKKYLDEENYRLRSLIPISFDQLVCNKKNYQIPRSHIKDIVSYPYAVAISSSSMALRSDDREKYFYLQRQIEKERLENKKTHVKDYLSLIDFDIPEYVSRDLDLLVQGSKDLQKQKFLKR